MTDRQSISVILCAYTLDRWDDLREAIASLRAQARAADEIILVIDHNEDLLARAAALFEGVRVVPNALGSGLSGGRNTGLALAGGDLIAFLDDDAVAAPDWLARFEAAFADPDVLGATGAVAPLWVGARPGWFPAEFLWTVGCTFPGAEALAGGEVRNVMGCSMIFRRSVPEAIGGFSHRLGRLKAGANLLSCEETEYCIRARAAFPRGRFVSAQDARVDHRVTAARMTFGYFLRRTHAEGISKAIVAALAARRGVLGTERSYVLRTLGAAVLRDAARGLLRLDRHSLARAGAILAGLGSASLGFLRGRAMLRAEGRPAAGATAPGLSGAAGS
ncbi:glycosyltransferase [Roseomonas nepalensis]|uniref:Glycosyltransferase n=1 Tax=Muricoccus nepalensis TaxID=1854500 RepID=A0A502F346_9PROT|nr:glycosyltransferase family 2 protein [Roseomonas nepalensis]TPG44257.1 glycosyltransferase [Roseomonas nepalensis]